MGFPKGGPPLNRPLGTMAREKVAILVRLYWYLEQNAGQYRGMWDSWYVNLIRPRYGSMYDLNETRFKCCGWGRPYMSDRAARRFPTVHNIKQ